MKFYLSIYLLGLFVTLCNSAYLRTNIANANSSIEKSKNKDLTELDIKIPTFTWAYVLNVIDCNTIVVMATSDNDNSEFIYDDDNSNVLPWTISIDGYQCPHLVSSITTEKQCAILARSELQNKLQTKMVQINILELDDNHKLWADVFINGISINDILKVKGLSVGPNDSIPNDWMKYHYNRTRIT